MGEVTKRQQKRLGKKWRKIVEQQRTVKKEEFERFFIQRLHGNFSNIEAKEQQK